MKNHEEPTPIAMEEVIKFRKKSEQAVPVTLRSEAKAEEKKNGSNNDTKTFKKPPKKPKKPFKNN